MLSRELTHKEIVSAQQHWRSVFARRLHRLTGRWVRGLDREVFRPRYVFKYLTGAAAEMEYRNAKAHNLLVIDEQEQQGELYDCRDGDKPLITDFAERRGVLIVPDDFSWTATTGPDYGDRVCFTYEEWVDDADSSENGRTT